MHVICECAPTTSGLGRVIGRPALQPILWFGNGVEQLVSDYPVLSEAGMIVALHSHYLVDWLTVFVLQDSLSWCASCLSKRFFCDFSF